MSNGLKPCPFCGGKAVPVNLRAGLFVAELEVLCTRCAVSVMVPVPIGDMEPGVAEGAREAVMEEAKRTSALAETLAEQGGKMMELAAALLRSAARKGN